MLRVGLVFLFIAWASANPMNQARGIYDINLNGYDQNGNSTVTKAFNLKLSLTKLFNFESWMQPVGLDSRTGPTE